MKNTYKLALVSFAVAGILSSCKQYEIDEVFHDSAVLNMDATAINVLDENLATGIDFVSEKETVSSVKVYTDSNEIWSGSASENKVEFSVTRDQLGLTESDLDAYTKVYVDATVDGRLKQMYTYYTLKSESSIGLGKVEDTDDEDPLYYGSSAVKTVEYVMKSALSITVKAEKKVGAKSDYTTYFEGDYSDDAAKFELVATDYDKADTIFFRVSATTSAGVDVVEYSTTLIEDFISIDSDAVLNAVDLADGKSLNLTNGTIEVVESSVPAIQFTHDFSSFTQGVIGANVEFYVPSTDDEKAMSSVIDIHEMLSGKTLVSSLNDLSVGDLVFYTYSIKGADYVGQFEVKELNSNRTERDDYVELVYGSSVVDLGK